MQAAFYVQNGTKKILISGTDQVENMIMDNMTEQAGKGMALKLSKVGPNEFSIDLVDASQAPKKES